MAYAKTQANSDHVPACKSCHEPLAKDTNLLMPNLKGAYHRQCLNCHREWAHANGCGACHRQRDPNRPIAATLATAPTVTDITGRMHPPIPEPVETKYVARFTPAVGRNVLFRHGEHTRTFGLKCVSCHREDSCATCHAAGATAATVPVSKRPVHPGRTWIESHGACVGCHQNDACRTCHYHYNDKPPAPFAHASATGQVLDKDHANLKCGQCHVMKLRSREGLSCGGASCHAKRPIIAFPVDRPGPRVTTRPANVVQVAKIVQPSPATQPTTRAVIKRVRR
jgi:hypothetical protein